MQDINLYHLFKFYLKKWAWIVGFTMLGALIGFVYSNWIQTPLYKSDATLLVVDGAKSSQDTLINNYIELIKSRRVLDSVINDFDGDLDYEDLSKSVEATNEKNTEIIDVSISYKDAESSKKLLEGALISFKNEVKSLYNKDNVIIVDEASLPSEPFNMKVMLQTVVASAICFASTIVVLFFVYDINSTLTDEEKAAKESERAKKKQDRLEKKAVRKANRDKARAAKEAKKAKVKLHKEELKTTKKADKEKAKASKAKSKAAKKRAKARAKAKKAKAKKKSNGKNVLTQVFSRFIKVEEKPVVEAPVPAKVKKSKSKTKAKAKAKPASKKKPAKKQSKKTTKAKS